MTSGAEGVVGTLAVVLGNQVSREGTPSPRLRARLETAIALYRARQVDRVLVSGGIDRRGTDEAAAMAAYLLSNGIAAAAVVRDPHGSDTFATARATAALIAPDAKVVIVTQWFHVPRTLLAMRRFGLRRVSAAWPRYVEARDAYSVAREIVALPYYAFRRVAPAAAAGSRPGQP